LDNRVQVRTSKRIPPYTAAEAQEVDDELLEDASSAIVERVDKEGVERCSEPHSVDGIAVCERK
jgi:hypothetical protein